MKQLTLCIFLLTMLLMQSCIFLPIPTDEDKVLKGIELSDEDISFIHENETTKDDVINNIGKPYIILKEKNIYIYKWTMRRGLIFYGAGGYLGGYSNIIEIEKNHLILIKFNEKNIVTIFEKIYCKSSESCLDVTMKFMNK